MRHPLLAEFEATDFLQIITLLATRDRRNRHLSARPGDDRVPAVSCKRRDVLRLDLDDYRRWADAVTAALPRAVRFLHGEGVHVARNVPYRTQLVPLTAILVALGARADGHAITGLLRRWYWCGVLGEMYGGSTETRFANDLQDVVEWVDGGREPRTVLESQFQAGRLLTLRRRNSAAYKGVYALQMKRGARDFRTGAPIDLHAYVDDAIDIHHVFPRAWYTAQGIDADLADSIVNKTAIDAHTNRRIGGSAPDLYLKRIQDRDGISAEDLDTILRSHDIDPLALRSNDFAGFVRDRFSRLIRQIEEVTGKDVNRAADGSDEPFAEVDESAQLAASVRRVIGAGESTVVEFKSTGRRNLHTRQRDQAMEWAVVRSVAGFMNKAGGTLLVGVADDGSVVGIEEDLPLLGAKQDVDGWGLWLTSALTSMIGQAAATDVEVAYADIDGRTVVRLTVTPGSQPVFATPPKGRETFFGRINSATQELGGQSLLDYKSKHWPG